MTDEADRRAGHDDAVAWRLDDVDVDPSNFEIEVAPAGVAGRRFRATGPCPGCGATVTSSRDEVDLGVPITRYAVKLDRRWGGGVGEGSATRQCIQLTFNCDCPHSHKGNPEEKNPSGCGRRWSLMLARSW